METSEQYRGRAVSPERTTLQRARDDMNDSSWKRLALRSIAFFITAEGKLYGKDT
jgi:hypothetical protein